MTTFLNTFLFVFLFFVFFGGGGGIGGAITKSLFQYFPLVSFVNPFVSHSTFL